MRFEQHDTASMVLASCPDGRLRNVLRWEEKMGSLCVAHCHGVSVDRVRTSNKDLRFHCRISCLYLCVCKKRTVVEKRQTMIARKRNAAIAQWIEQRTSNPQVVGSNPTRGTSTEAFFTYIMKAQIAIVSKRNRIRVPIWAYFPQNLSSPKHGIYFP